MAECPYYKGHECIALDLYREDRDRYPYSPCTKDCNQLRIKHLEDKIEGESNPLDSLSEVELFEPMKHFQD